jgi:uncharacterized protein YgbK (DUF1537 family)
MTLDALVVADDLTGAMDTGHEFAARGHPTTVGVRPTADPPDEGVFVANTDSRYLPPADAAAAVERAVRETPAGLVYKKVDSTLRGNLVAEIGAAVEASGADCALVAPAFPAGGRLTACGYHLVGGALVTDTDAGRDPDKPVASAHLPTLLGDADRPVRHVGVGTVARGADAVADAVGGTMGEFLACDAVHGDHLAALARGAARSGRDVVYVGSAGLAGAVELPDGSATMGQGMEEPPADGRVLGIAGSASPVTVEQLSALPAGAVVPLDVARAVTDPAGAAAAAATEATDRSAARGAAVVASVLGDGDVDRALEAGEAAGLAPGTVRDRVAESLALTAEGVWERAPPDGLFVTGGAVAGRVFDALGVTGVRLTGEAVESGVPVGRALDGAAADTWIVTKAGAFGDERTIVNCLARLGGSDG